MTSRSCFKTLISGGDLNFLTCGRTSAGQESIAPCETPAKHTGKIMFIVMAIMVVMHMGDISRQSPTLIDHNTGEDEE